MYTRLYPLSVRRFVSMYPNDSYRSMFSVMLSWVYSSRLEYPCINASFSVKSTSWWAKP